MNLLLQQSVGGGDRSAGSYNSNSSSNYRGGKFRFHEIFRHVFMFFKN